jgi:hypothetical protein
VPSGARIAIVSTIARPLTITSGPISTADFNSVWNAAPYTKPSYLSAWAGKGDDLVIQRVNLDPLFHRLILLNRDPQPDPASFSINSTNTRFVTNWISSYYLDGTVVGLCTNTVPMYRFVLTSDISFAFDRGMWRSTFSGGGSDNSALAKTFVAFAQNFTSITNTAASASATGADTQGALSGIYAFMYTFTLWANRCPHFYAGSASINSSSEYSILDKLGANSVGLIDTATGNGGLLK